MTQDDKEKITKFLKTNLHTHKDWTGTYVETQYKCDSVEKFIEIFFNSIEEKTQEDKELLLNVFHELKESEDEKVRKRLIDLIYKVYANTSYITCVEYEDTLAWLEKQSELKNKINSCKITFEDVLALECSMKTAKITKGGDELYKILVPLYNKIHNAYLDEKQSEQKPTDKVEPKFKVGDIIRFKGNGTLKGEAETHKIVSYDNELYVFADGTTDLFCEQDLYELVEHNPNDKIEQKFAGKENKSCIKISEAHKRIYDLRRMIPYWNEIIRQSKLDISSCISHGLVKSDYVPFEEYTFGNAIGRLDEARFMINSIGKEIRLLKKEISLENKKYDISMR